MRRFFILTFLTLLAGALLAAPVLAHGGAEIAVEPSTVPAGGTITLTGEGLGAGETFDVHLEGLSGTIELGEFTADAEGRVVTRFALPADLEPGSYVVEAVAEDGEAVTAELQVVASEAPAAAVERQTTAATMELDRSRTWGEWLAAGLVIVLSLAGGGYVLLRS